MIGPIRSILFVPGTRQDRFAKAMNAGADAVVFDLEDSVEAGQKPQARALVAEFLATPRPRQRAVSQPRLRGGPCKTYIATAAPV